jgi:hypothetical protein
MENNEEYFFERFTAVHYPVLQMLFNDAFDIKISIPEIEKRFSTASLGAPVIGYIAFHKSTGRPAAYYGIFPLRLQLNGKVVLAAQSGDTMTHSLHKKKGLFVQLANAVYEDCRKEGIHFLYGSPNEKSYKGLVKNLQWQHNGDILRLDMKLKMKTIPLPKIFSKHNRPSQAYLRYAKFVLKPYLAGRPVSFRNPLHPSLPRVFRDEYHISYKQDAYKFFIRIHEVTCWVKLADVFWIGDFSDYQQVTEQVTTKLKRIAFLLGYNTVRMNINEDVQLPEAFLAFKINGRDAACYKVLSDEAEFQQMIWTGADFDTW